MYVQLHRIKPTNKRGTQTDQWELNNKTNNKNKQARKQTEKQTFLKIAVLAITGTLLIFVVEISVGKSDPARLLQAKPWPKQSPGQAAEAAAVPKQQTLLHTLLGCAGYFASPLLKEELADAEGSGLQQPRVLDEGTEDEDQLHDHGEFS